MFDKEVGVAGMLLLARAIGQVKGIMVNTFVELESHAIQSFFGTTLPPLYPVGPILSTQAESVDASTIIFILSLIIFSSHNIEYPWN